MSALVTASKPSIPPANTQSEDLSEESCMRAMVEGAMQYLSDALSTAGKAILPDPIAEPDVQSVHPRRPTTAGPSLDEAPSDRERELEASRVGYIE